MHSDVLKIQMHKLVHQNARPRCLSCRAQSSSALMQLKDVIKDRKRGVNDSKKDQSEIRKLCDAIVAGSSTSTGSLSGTWRLLWTTEQETLFILKNAPLLQTEAGEVYQVTDTVQRTLQNVILFPPEGKFVVDSSLTVESETRCSFKFTSATLGLPNKEIKLPPFGQGWFDSVFNNDEIRIAKDSRGDLLVVEKCGPPRRF